MTASTAAEIKPVADRWDGLRTVMRFDVLRRPWKPYVVFMAAGIFLYKALCPDLAAMPLEVQESIITMASPFVMLTAIVLTLIHTSNTIMRERKCHTLDALLLTRLTSKEIIGGRLLMAMALVYIILAVPLLIVTYDLFRSNAQGFYIWLPLAVLGNSASFGAIGIYCSARFNTLSTAIIVGILLSLTWIIAPLFCFWLLYSPKFSAIYMRELGNFRRRASSTLRDKITLACIKYFGGTILVLVIISTMSVSGSSAILGFFPLLFEPVRQLLSGVLLPTHLLLQALCAYVCYNKAVARLDWLRRER